MNGMLKRYLATSAVILFLATLYSMWRENCTPGCAFDKVVLGLPVFLRTPYSPDSPVGPEFFLIPLLINIVWSAAVSVSFWAVVETFGRWRERKGQEPFM